jgi:hypothetical protein
MADTADTGSWWDSLLGTAKDVGGAYLGAETAKANAQANAAIAQAATASATAQAKSTAFPAWAKYTLITVGGVVGIIVLGKLVKGLAR